MTLRNRILNANPANFVLATFLLTMVAGTFLLKLPISTTSGEITWVDAFFTSTSAVCVTGLVVVDTGTYFTTFGQWVILALIQIGGLGVMTISVAMFRWVGRNVAFRHRMLMQDLFAHTPREDIFSLVRGIVIFTLGAEALGAVVLTIHLSQELPFLQAVYSGVFHSISAFCNGGFSLFPDNMMSYRDDLVLNATICVLIVAGGIGFPVIYELQTWFPRGRNERVRLSLQSKTVLLTSLILIVAGAAVFAFLEQGSLANTRSLTEKILIPVFQSITCRTAGFNTVDIGSLNEATLTLIIFLMFFGASPGSCGGGVKTTTLALLVASTVSRVRRKPRVTMFNKSIPDDTVTRSMSLILVSTGMISLTLFIILAGDALTGHNLAGGSGSFLAYLFETVSAFGTVGLSTGITSELNPLGKCLLTMMMVVGRVGVLTFSYIIVGTRKASGVEYSEENLMIG